MRQDNHTISLFVANKPGVLLRVCLIFARRGFNIESLVVSSALDGKFSRMTITAQGAHETLDQIIKQANKLVDVVHCCEHTEIDSVDIELALIKVGISAANRAELLQIVEHFKAETLDLTQESLIINIYGPTERINACLDMLAPYKLLELVRTGKMVMAKGKEQT